MFPALCLTGWGTPWSRADRSNPIQTGIGIKDRWVSIPPRGSMIKDVPISDGDQTLSADVR
jgi:hypothetical protein